MIPLDPFTIGIGGAALILLRNRDKIKPGTLTPEREEVYVNALEYLKEPDKLIDLAEAFQKEGLKVQAAVLRARAAWRSRTPEVKAEHDAIYARALASENAPAVLKVALAFEQKSATARAKKLREHAAALKARKASAELPEAEEPIEVVEVVVTATPEPEPKTEE